MVAQKQQVISLEQRAKFFSPRVVTKDVIHFPSSAKEVDACVIQKPSFKFSYSFSLTAQFFSPHCRINHWIIDFAGLARLTACPGLSLSFDEANSNKESRWRLKNMEERPPSDECYLLAFLKVWFFALSSWRYFHLTAAGTGPLMSILNLPDNNSKHLGI